VALFSRKKDSRGEDTYTLTDPDEILGYLDEVFRRRVSLSYYFKSKEYVSDVLLLDAKLGALRIQQSTMQLPHGSDVTAGFPLDRTWWSFQTKYMLRDGKPYLLYPKVIRHTERRRNQRTNFSPREQVKVTILEGLGSGHGVFGLAQDISVDGLSLTIEKAMNLASEKEVPPSPSLFPKGTKLAVVKINKIPGCPLMEISGVAQRLERDGKWVMSLSFHKLSKQHQGMIAKFVEPRLLDFKPTKRSYKRRQELESEGGGGVTPAEGARPTPSQQTDDEQPEATNAEQPLAAEPTSAAPTPEAEPAVPVAARTGPKIRMLVLGEELIGQLDFLAGAERFELLPGNTPVGIIKILSELKPPLMLCGLDFKGRDVTELLTKIDNMGALAATKVVVCAENLMAKDIIKLKMMKIEDTLDLAGDPNELLEQLIAMA